MNKKFNLQEALRNFEQLPHPKTIKKIDFINKVIIGCIPVKASSVPPDDQSPCIIEKCLSCSQEIWVSEKKRKHRDNKPNVEIYCFQCMVLSMKLQGLNPLFNQPKLVDINSFN